MIMKRLGIIAAALAATVALASPVFAEWTKAAKGSSDGVIVTQHLDLQRLDYIDGQLTFWQLTDFDKPSRGVLSIESHISLDCDSKMPRSKTLSSRLYASNMGQDFIKKGKHDPEWYYSSPNDFWWKLHAGICQRIKKEGL